MDFLPSISGEAYAGGFNRRHRIRGTACAGGTTWAFGIDQKRLSPARDCARRLKTRYGYSRRRKKVDSEFSASSFWDVEGQIRERVRGWAGPWSPVDRGPNNDPW